jgi:hypothetical protein
VPEIPRIAVPAADALAAARRIADSLSPADPALTIVFGAATTDFETLAAELSDLLPRTRLVGCSTAGEIGPDGLARDTIVAVGLPSAHFSASTALIDLSDPSLDAIVSAADGAMARLTPVGQAPTRDTVFAMLFADGLAGREELLASTLHDALGGVPLCGGSAGDAMTFTRTVVMNGREVRTNAAVLTLVHTRLPFVVFKTQHFLAGDDKLIVTAADASQRTVHEFNGEPAAAEYARVVGVPEESFGPSVFADHPVVVKMGGDSFVRALARVNPDRSLTFMCAMEEGVVLTVARGLDLVSNLETAMSDVQRRVGPLSLVVGCDCVLRRLEVERRGLTPAVNGVFGALPVVGFATYGEQLNATHVNQTLTGIAIGGDAAGHA